MDNILILYSGKFGSTEKACKILSDCFEKKGKTSVLMDVSKAEKLDNYKKIVLASPIYYGKCQGEIIDFLFKFSGEIKDREVSFLFTCLRLTRTGEETDTYGDIFIDGFLDEGCKDFKKMGMMEKSHCIDYYLKPLTDMLTQLGKVKIGFFKGRLDYKILDFKSRWVMKIMSLFMEQVFEGDFLNQQQLETWADELLKN